MMRTIFRATRWLTFAAFLFGVGWIIYQVLPPRPRWVVKGGIELKGFLPDSSGVVLVERENAENGRDVTVRDIASGAVRTSVHVKRNRYFTHDKKRLVWMHEEDLLAGIDLQTGKEWRRPLPLERVSPRVQFSDDGDVAVLYGNHSIFIIDTRDGKIFDQSKWPANELVPEPQFTRKLVVLAYPDRDIRVWDRSQGVATTLPIRCDSVTMSPAGDAMLLVNMHNPGEPLNPRPDARSLVDYPSGARPLELGMGPFQFSPDGKYLAISCRKERPDGTPASGECIDLWDVAARRLVTTLDERHTDAYINQVFSADGRLLIAVAGDDLAVHELPGGKELWRWKGATEKKIFHYYAPSSALVGIPLSHRFRSKSFPGNGGPEPVEIRDAESGRLRLSHLRPPPTSIELDFSNHDRYVVLADPIQAEDGPMVAFLKNWLPEAWFAQGDRYPYQLAVFDIEEAACLFEGELRLEHDAGRFRISNDGRSLLVDHAPPSSPTRTIECWDIPFARPWGWIIGVPVGLGCVLLLLGKWRKVRLARKRIPKQIAAPASGGTA